MESCAFDKLFTKSVPHILEKMFFSLNYASFKNCMKVSRAWNELLTTKQYQMKVKLVFHEELKKDEKNLWNASGGGRSDEVRRLLSSGMLDVECEFGCTLDTPLHQASYYGRIEVVQTLLNKGADPNKTDRNGNTPLHDASINGHKMVVQILLEGGANPNKKNGIQFTPLHRASVNGHNEVVQLLLKGGAEPHEANKYGLTPLDHASRNGHKNVEKVLLEWKGSS